MSFLDRFRRDDESEDSSYYRAEPATSRFTAILFGFFALFVTLLIAGGLFFGGRAVYRALNGTPAENTSEQQDQNQNENDQNQPADAPTSETPSQSQQQNPSSQPSTGDNPSTVPSTGDTPAPESTLPRTGDEGM